ncbi:MAG TPA: DALR domain-containing protein, partial [Solirubrobacterales bacterium]
EALDRFGGQTVVAYLASGHYHQPLAFSEEQLEEAAARVERIRNYFRDAPTQSGGSSDMQRVAPSGSALASPGPPPQPDPFLIERRQAFVDALADDFNTPQAFAVLFEIVAEGNRRDLPGAREVLSELLPLLGLESLLRESDDVDPEAGRLLSERERARAERDFERADALRDRLSEMGWEVRDEAGGARLVRRR